MRRAGRRRWIGAAAFGAGATLAGGCAATSEFASTYTTSVSGIAGRSWQAPYRLDTSALPYKAYTQPLLFNSWDVAASVGSYGATYGARVQLAATWINPLTGVYGGWARLFDETAGWSASGTAFGAVAADTASFGFPSVAAGPGGTFLTSFFGAAGARSVSASFAPQTSALGGGAWSATAVNATLPNYPDFPAAQSRGAGPYVKTVMDAAGRGYVFFADTSGAGALYLSSWLSSSATGLSSTLQAASGGTSLASRSGITALDDGGGAICFTYETAAASLRANCVDTTTGALGAAASTLSTDLVAGHEAATDGAGGIMVVYYQRSGSNYHVYASLRAGGAWAAAGQPDEAASSNFPAASPATIVGARPGVAYVGGGRYLAAWVAVDTSALATQVLYSLYDPATGWGAAAGVPGTVETYLAVPHAQSLAVFGNGDGNAGFALNHIHTTEAMGGVAASLPTYLESDQVRDVMAARWQTKVGWLPVTTFGNLCYVAGAGATATNPQCTHRPQAVLLPSGRTLVFFADRDDYLKTGTSGNVRIAVGEFK